MSASTPQTPPTAAAWAEVEITTTPRRSQQQRRINADLHGVGGPVGEAPHGVVGAVGVLEGGGEGDPPRKVPVPGDGEGALERADACIEIGCRRLVVDVVKQGRMWGAGRPSYCSKLLVAEWGEADHVMIGIPCLDYSLGGRIRVRMFGTERYNPASRATAAAAPVSTRILCVEWYRKNDPFKTQSISHAGTAPCAMFATCCKHGPRNVGFLSTLDARPKRKYETETQPNTQTREKSSWVRPLPAHPSTFTPGRTCERGNIVATATCFSPP